MFSDQVRDSFTRSFARSLTSFIRALRNDTSHVDALEAVQDDQLLRVLRAIRARHNIEAPLSATSVVQVREKVTRIRRLTCDI